MDSFSSNAEEVIKKQILCVNDVLNISDEADFVEIFDLTKCLHFIEENKFTKVCLQFPDNLLQFSVKVALWLEKKIKQKVFILGDTSYGSCCVDELAAEHIDADAVIHMGHACLSPTSRLPVLYVLPKAELDLQKFMTAFITHCSHSKGPIVLLYDFAYYHLLGKITNKLKESDCSVIISQPRLPGSDPEPCSQTCELLQGSQSHQTNLLGRAYCCNSPDSFVYIAHNSSQNMINFALSLRDVQLISYAEGEIKTLDVNRTLRRRLFLMEKIKDAKTIGILVGTLSVDKFLGAIERVKKLAAYRGKRCYIFSVGKPNPAKLANFPEIEVFVLISCPEACLEGEKEYLQPVVTLVEVELALNSKRQWNDNLSMDFRDLLEDAPNYKALPEGLSPLEADVSLINNKIRVDNIEITDDSISDTLCTKEHYQISVASSYNEGRSWKGLEQALGETPVAQVVKGRSGIPLAYDGEKSHQTS